MILLIIVQILIESLPLSSSGHSMLVYSIFRRFGRELMMPSRGLLYVAHMPTVSIAGMFFWRRWMLLLRRFSLCKKYIVRLIGYGLLAEIITVVIYVLGSMMVRIPLWLGFAITAAGFMSLSQVPYRLSRMRLVVLYSVLGFAQGCAVLPGISRLGITYIAGRWCGLSPKNSFTYAWTLAIPLYIGACCVGIILEPGAIVKLLCNGYMIGMVIIGAMALFWLAYYMMTSHREILFAYYLIIVAILAAWLKA